MSKCIHGVSLRRHCSHCAVDGHAALAEQHDNSTALRKALTALMQLDVAGHQLQDRLQFSTAGREILHQCQAALAGDKQ